jgi:hypothetical protein
LRCEIIVKRVEGRVLRDVEFKRKDPSTGKYDLVARAREGELQVDLACRQLLIRLHSYSFFVADGSSRFVPLRTWAIDLSEEFTRPEE